jgi:hypothetical protein
MCKNKRTQTVDYSIYTFKEEDDRGYYINGVYHAGYKDKRGYIIDNIKSKQGNYYPFLEHVTKWEYFNGKIPEGLQIDHILPTRNGGTNKLSNLRLAKIKENANNELSLINKSESHKGKKQTEDTKKKRSESMKGRLINNTETSKKVYQYSIDGELVAIWPSTMECERSGFCRTAVKKCCNGTYFNNNTYKNYFWKWEK